MKKIKKTFLFLFLMIILGFLSTQLYFLLQNNIKYITLSRVYSQKKELAEEKAKIELLKEKKIRIEEELSRYDSNKSDLNIIENLKSDIDKVKKLAGLSSVYGQGVIIIINDSDIINNSREASSLIVHDFDIQNIITDLRNAGAEAISVNGERVVAGKSKIKCAGPTIQINKRVVAQPFIIKAIGDKYFLEAAINSPNGYASVLKDWDIFIEVNTSVNIDIARYNGSLDFKHIKDYNGDEK